MKIINNIKGLSLIEMVISLGLLSVVALIGVSGLGTLNKDLKKSEVRTTRSEIVESLFSRFGDDAKKLQVDYSERTAFEILDDLDEFPMAWETDGRVGTIGECTKCKGRYAFVVKPFTNYRGLFQMTIRIQHPSLNVGDNYVEATKLLGNF